MTARSDPQPTWRAMIGGFLSDQEPANSAPEFPKLDVPRCPDGMGLPSLLTLAHSAPVGKMAEPRKQRRLAAIFAADMVGYSRLVEADERGTIARQKVHRTELIDPKIAEHYGRIVKTTGDGMLMEFGSAEDSVRCAVAVREGMAERNRGPYRRTVFSMRLE